MRQFFDKRDAIVSRDTLQQIFSNPRKIINDLPFREMVNLLAMRDNNIRQRKRLNVRRLLARNFFNPTRQEIELAVILGVDGNYLIEFAVVAAVERNS